MMPLGLLKCMITWFSAHLSEDESKSILYSIKQGDALANKSLASLICEWVRMGYSGKTSVENFRKDLRKMFNGRCSFPSEQQFKEKSSYRPSETNSLITAKTHTSSSSSSGSTSTKTYDTLYSSGINLHVFFPQTLKISSSLPTFPSGNSGASPFYNLESRPMDHILFFHKALKKDLEHLVLVSATLVENLGVFPDFHRHFHLIRFLYQIHSDSEDDIAFPALEAKGKFRNISNSYAIDHKLEVEHFNKISLILDEICELHLLVSRGDVDARGQKMLKYRQMCVKLHDMCLSMHKILFDHINHEEIELWPLFVEHFSIQEQEKIIGCMLGRIRAEILQEMIPWLMASLTREEQHAIMSLWRKATKNTMFDEWLGEWWEGMRELDRDTVEAESNILPSHTADPLEVVSAYLSSEGFHDQVCKKSTEFLQTDFDDYKTKPTGIVDTDDKEEALNKDQYSHQSSECTTNFSGEVHKKRFSEIADATDQADKQSKVVQVSQKSEHEDHLVVMSQEELEAAIRRVSRDCSLDPGKKSYIIQNMLMRLI